MGDQTFYFLIIIKEYLRLLVCLADCISIMLWSIFWASINQ